MHVLMLFIAILVACTVIPGQGLIARAESFGGARTVSSTVTRTHHSKWTVRPRWGGWSRTSQDGQAVFRTW